MLCSRVQNLLSAYCDQELAGAEMLQIRQHLTTCSTCEQEYYALRRIKTLMGSLPAVDPTQPVDLDELVRARSPHHRILSWWQSQVAAPLVALAGVEIHPESLLPVLRTRSVQGALCGICGVLGLAVTVARQPQPPDAVRVHVPEAITSENLPDEVPGWSGAVRPLPRQVATTGDLLPFVTAASSQVRFTYPRAGTMPLLSLERRAGVEKSPLVPVGLVRSGFAHAGW
jgi:hypothetical protein